MLHKWKISSFRSKSQEEKISKRERLWELAQLKTVGVISAGQFWTYDISLQGVFKAWIYWALKGTVLDDCFSVTSKPRGTAHSRPWRPTFFRPRDVSAKKSSVYIHRRQGDADLWSKNGRVQKPGARTSRLPIPESNFTKVEIKQFAGLHLSVKAWAQNCLRAVMPTLGPRPSSGFFFCARWAYAKTSWSRTHHRNCLLGVREEKIPGIKMIAPGEIRKNNRASNGRFVTVTYTNRVLNSSSADRALRK